MEYRPDEYSKSIWLTGPAVDYIIRPYLEKNKDRYSTYVIAKHPCTGYVVMMMNSEFDLFAKNVLEKKFEIKLT